jgi:predicted N-acyltransferase
LLSPELSSDERKRVAEALILESESWARSCGAHSLHFLFCSEPEERELAGMALLPRKSYQYHWRNRGYADFSAFALALKSRKRKAVLRERQAVRDAGVEIETFTGVSLPENSAELMYGFYLTTAEKWGAIPYLNQAFLEQVFREMPNRVVLTLARQHGEWVAGSLAFRKGRALYGRYWGARREIPFLHFELCYYRLIELAIAERLDRLEAGAQGEHKLARGFLPERTHSAHRLFHPRFASAVEDFIRREGEAVDRIMAEGLAQSPYREDAAEPD